MNTKIKFLTRGSKFYYSRKWWKWWRSAFDLCNRINRFNAKYSIAVFMMVIIILMF